MASLILNVGLNLALEKLSAVSGAGAALVTMAVDDSANALVATDTAANTGGAITNFFAQAFDSTPTRTNQTTSHIMTLATGSYNQVIKRITLHNTAAGSTTASSTGIFGGVDGQSITKNSSYTLAITMKITAASA